MKIQTALLACALAIAAPLAPALAEDAPNYIEDMKRWQPKAEAGDAEAQFQLGQMYALGHGFKQNFNSALEWYEKAAAQGNAKARTALGLLYFYGVGVEENTEKAGEWFEKAAAQDNPIAQTFLGAIAYEAKDYATAMQWAEQAAAQNYAPAISSIGLLYERGDGVTQDFVEAKRWYERAANYKKRSVMAMFALSKLYSEGKGVKKDEKQAMEWLEKACALNTLDSGAACYEIGKNYFDGKLGLIEDRQKAFEYSMKAALNGNISGALLLKKLKENKFVFPNTEKEQVLEFINKVDDHKYWVSRFAMQALENLQD